MTNVEEDAISWLLVELIAGLCYCVGTIVCLYCIQIRGACGWRKRDNYS